MRPKSVLLVDDDEDIIEFLEYNIKKSGYIVYTANNGNEAINIAIDKKPDVIILDIMMPGMDGIQVCEHLKNLEDDFDSMVMFLTARGEDYSQIAGFSSGCDDFVVKPVNPKILIKRIDALIRRRNVKDRYGEETETRKYTGKLHIDKERYTVYYKQHEVILPRKEFLLLSYLASKPGKVFLREEIYSKVWGDSCVGDRTIDVHIRRLREKFDDELILTINGLGYRLNIPV